MRGYFPVSIGIRIDCIDRHAIGNVDRWIEDNTLACIETLLDVDLRSIVSRKLDAAQMRPAVGSDRNAQ